MRISDVTFNFSDTPKYSVHENMMSVAKTLKQKKKLKKYLKN